MGMLKSTPTSDGEEPVSLPCHPDFNWPVKWAFLQYIRECQIRDGKCPLFHIANGHPCNKFPEQVTRSTFLKNVFYCFYGGARGPWPGREHPPPVPNQQSRRPWSFWTFFKKSLKMTASHSSHIKHDKYTFSVDSGLNIGIYMIWAV